MSQDPYKSPESNVAVATKEVAELPNPFVVALLMVAVSLAIGAVIATIEFFLGFTFPGNSFLTTVIPALVVGTYYGKKRQALFPRNFRIKVVLIWLAIGILLAAIAFGLIAPDFLRMMLANIVFVAIFVGVVLLGCVICYFAISFGEKLAIKSLAKKA